jgi:hypothetical protein
MDHPGHHPSSPLDGWDASLAALEGAASAFDFRQRGNLLDLDRQLHRAWALGRNLVLAWCPTAEGIAVLVVPHYAIADYSAAAGRLEPQAAGERERFVAELLSGSRRFSSHQLGTAARLLQAEPQSLTLRQPLAGSGAETSAIDRMVRRYGVSYVASRAVALFDIVGFGLLRPFEQMTQLNSLAHSLNSAHSKMLGSHLSVNFSRSTTGDGFYIWNHDAGLGASTSLYHLMHLVLADNAIARSKARSRTVPLLRACFHLGPCYEFHHAEGLNPTLYSQIVGDVTIELARMIEQALPGQILVGDFAAALDPATRSGAAVPLDTVGFIEQAQADLARLNGLELAGEAIESIKCYLTGDARDDGSFTIRRLAINDKHGLTHQAFNAKVNIYRRAAAPILLGIEDRQLRGVDFHQLTTGHIQPPGVAR